MRILKKTEKIRTATTNNKKKNKKTTSQYQQRKIGHVTRKAPTTTRSAECDLAHQHKQNLNKPKQQRRGKRSDGRDDEMRVPDKNVDTGNALDLQRTETDA